LSENNCPNLGEEHKLAFPSSKLECDITSPSANFNGDENAETQNTSNEDIETQNLEHVDLNSRLLNEATLKEMNLLLRLRLNSI